MARWRCVHFDAHRDVEPDDGGRIDHGTMFNYAVREGVIDPGALDPDRHPHHLSRRAHLRHARSSTPTRSIDRRRRRSRRRSARRSASSPAYLTFDIDCLDPAFAPGTGTPVPGGLSSHQALSILRELKDVDFVGMDVVEVSPPYDHAEITALAAATIALEYSASRPGRKARGRTSCRDRFPFPKRISAGRARERRLAFSRSAFPPQAERSRAAGTSIAATQDRRRKCARPGRAGAGCAPADRSAPTGRE